MLIEINDTFILEKSKILSIEMTNKGKISGQDKIEVQYEVGNEGCTYEFMGNFIDFKSKMLKIN